MDLHHPITREFPFHLETIRQLKNTNDQFRKAFNEYHRLDDAIFRVEEDIDFASDQEIQEMKLERARLKDWIYQAIHKVQPAASPTHAEGVDLHHPLVYELPKHKDAITYLRSTNDSFRKAYNEYHHVDDSIYRIEEEIDDATDQELQDLKRRRAKLKDWLFHTVTHTPVVK